MLAQAVLSALWRAYCGVAETINTKHLGQTDEALKELKSRLLEHAAKITETVSRSKQLCQTGLALDKRPRSSPTPSLGDDATDAGELIQRKKRVIHVDEGDDDE